MEAVDVDFDNAGRRWRRVHGSTAVRLARMAVRYQGLVEGRAVRRRQLPVVLCWAKTIHKSQGATEERGVYAHLDAQAARQPSLAYVAVSRCRRRSSLHLTALTEGCFASQPGVRRALLQLLRAQALRAAARPRAWRSLFEPAETLEELDAKLRAAAPAPQLLARKRRLDAQDAVARGDPASAVCAWCGGGFATEAALERHRRGCAARPRERRRRLGSSAAAPPAEPPPPPTVPTPTPAPVPTPPPQVPTPAAPRPGRRWRHLDATAAALPMPPAPRPRTLPPQAPVVQLLPVLLCCLLCATARYLAAGWLLLGLLRSMDISSIPYGSSLM